MSGGGSINNYLEKYQKLNIFRNFSEEEINDYMNYNVIFGKLAYSEIKTNKYIENNGIKVLDFNEEEVNDYLKKLYLTLTKLNKNVKILKYNDKEFPMEILKKDSGYPMYCYYVGDKNLLNKNILSIVGLRKADENTMQKAFYLAEKLSSLGFVISSGLALGVDKYAHLGCLNKGYPTIAIIGTPITKFYPKENKELQKVIMEKGLVISMFSPLDKVNRWNFPKRNMLNSAVSLGTLIVNCGNTSGTLIQAKHCVKQNKVLILPNKLVEDQELNWTKNFLNYDNLIIFDNIDKLHRMLVKKIKNRKEGFSWNIVI